MNIMVFLLINAIVAISALLIALRLLRIRELIDLLPAWFIIVFAQIVFSELILGICGILYLGNLILLNSAILLICWLVSRRYGSSGGIRLPAEEFLRLFKNKYTSLIIALFLGFVIVKLIGNLMNPPFGWDSLNYHYTFPVEWIKNANLINPITVSEDPFPSYYPINGSLLYLWLIFPFRSAFLADLGQFPFFVLSLLAVYKISRRIGLAREYSFLAAALFTLMPNFLKQIEWGYVDIMICGMFLSALNYLLALRSKISLGSLLLFSLSLGLGIGIKTTVAPYMLLLVLPFILILFAARQISFLKKTGYIVFFALVSLCCGGYGYLRNFALTMNPLYPLDVAVAGKSLFKGVIDRATFTFRNEEHGYSFTKLLFHEGVGAQTLLFGLLGVIALPVNLFIKRNKNLFLNYILLLPVLLYLCYRYILPIPNTRYFYPGLATGIISGFFVLSALKVPVKFVKLLSLIVILASLAESARHLSLALSFGLSILLFICFLGLGKRVFRSRASRNLVVTFFLIGLLALIKSAQIDYQKNQYQRYISNSRYWPDATAAWEWLSRQGPSNIAYVGRPVAYPLYGRNLQNNVYYVSVNQIDPIKLHYLKNSRYRWSSNEQMHENFKEDRNYRGNADYATWRKNLLAHDTDYLFIYSFLHTLDTLFPMEEEWARNSQGDFEPVFDSETVKIYKINS